MRPEPRAGRVGTAPASRIEMPALARAASRRSRQAQTVFKTVMAAGLLLLIAAAFFGSLPARLGAVDVAGLLVLVAFLAAGGFRAYRLGKRPDRVWYGSRMLSEDLKSLAWCYAVGGRPFAIGARSSPDAETHFARHINTLVDRSREETLSLPAPEEDSDQITASMRELRVQPLETRRTRYAEARIGDQQRYYVRKAREFQRRANGWNIALYAAEGVGVLWAIGRLLRPLLLPAQLAAQTARPSAVQSILYTFFSYDLFGLAGTIVAAGTSWLQLNQYLTLSDTYSALAQKLGMYRERAMGPSLDEEHWARFVSEVERLLRDEHTQWRDMHDPDGFTTISIG
jgi:hypothetical protein